MGTLSLRTDPASSTDNERARDLLRRLDTSTHPLTRWEEDFVESLGERLAGGQGLTEGQFATLEQIYERRG